MDVVAGSDISSLPWPGLRSHVAAPHDSARLWRCTYLGEVRRRSRGRRHHDRHRRRLLRWGAVLSQRPLGLEVEEQFVDYSEKRFRTKFSDLDVEGSGVLNNKEIAKDLRDTNHSEIDAGAPTERFLVRHRRECLDVRQQLPLLSQG